MQNTAYEGTANVHLQFMNGHLPTSDTSCQLLCPVINVAMSNNFKQSHVHCPFR